MRKKIVFMLIFGLAAIIALSGYKVANAGLSAFEAYAAEQAQTADIGQKTIVVRASEEISVMPDVAHINLSVTTKDLNVEKAQKANAEIVNKAKEKISALGVDDKTDITTSNYSVYPIYEYVSGANKQTGHVVICSLCVRLKDFTLIGKVIDCAGTNGINGISGVEFSLSDTTEAYNTALSKAVENAKSKALVIASAHGVELGAPISIKETEQYENKISRYAVRAFAEDAATTINADKLMVKACVEVTYSIY